MATPRRERVTPLALALALGVALGWWLDRPVFWPWLSLCGLCLVGAALCQGRSRRAVAALIALGVFGLGVSWMTVRGQRVAAGELAACVGGAPLVVHARGVALEAPVLRDRAVGSMAPFDHRAPSTYFAMQVGALVSRDGVERPVRGELLVRVEETVTPFRAGDAVEARGLMYPPAPLLNPGGFDSRRFARSRGRAGLLSVPRRELVAVSPAEPGGLRGRALRWRETLRRRAEAGLLSSLPRTDRPQRDALLLALLLGTRGPGSAGLGDAFRRVGLAHFLAISGMHLGVFAGFVVIVLRIGGARRRWHGWLVMAAVLGYLVMVEVRMPVLRAGVMTMAACLGAVAGRRPRTAALVAGSAIGLLLWRPDQLMAPGFQLSFGVVLGLIHLAPLVRRRLFGLPDAFASSSARMLGQWLQTTCAAALTAWAVATPITLHHWGVLWPLAAPFSVIVLPVVAVILALGYLKMMLAIALPSAAMLAGVPLTLAADVLISLVSAMNAVPGSAVRIGHTSAAWSLCAEAWLCVLVVTSARWPWVGRFGRRALCISGAALACWLVWPLLPPPFGGLSAALRIDMLAVGDGSCYVVRSGRSTVVFDCGSSSDLDAGRRTIVPALERLGVRSIDAIAVSHPNLDHYSAVLELADAFGVGSVLVTPQLARAAAADPAGPVMHLLDGLSGRSVPVIEVARGRRMRFGDARWAWLHPEPARRFAHANDGSMVISIEAAGRRVLLCGDIQRQAMEILDACPRLQADVLELPHHGSFSRHAVEFIGAVDPQFVLQSTGPARWRRTRAGWEESLGGRRWLVSARDGASWIEIGPDGSMEAGSFLAGR